MKWLFRLIIKFNYDWYYHNKQLSVLTLFLWNNIDNWVGLHFQMLKIIQFNAKNIKNQLETSRQSGDINARAFQFEMMYYTALVDRNHIEKLNCIVAYQLWNSYQVETRSQLGNPSFLLPCTVASNATTLFRLLDQIFNFILHLRNSYKLIFEMQSSKSNLFNSTPDEQQGH